LTRVYWARDGRAVDRRGRDAARCRTEQEAAEYLADRTWQDVAAIEEGNITLGREAGPKLIRRFLLNIQALDVIAERDAEAATSLELADAAERHRRQGDNEP
jgi:hypothetical protein